MHKHDRVRVVWAVAAFAAVFTICSIARANTTSSWLSSNLTVQKQADTANVPPSMFDAGNTDCYPDDSGCAVPTAYGTSQGGSVNLGDKYYPVETYIDGRQHFIPIPNSSSYITYSTGAAYGVYMYFNYNFTSSVKFQYNNGQSYYQGFVPPDGKLADKGGRLLAGDSSSISFSPNGQWMVVSEPNVAVLRVNLQTFEVLPFAPGLSYSTGINPAPKTGITNDGRYAIVASKTANRFKIYDLDTCAVVPNSFSGPVACQSRDLGSVMRQQLPGFGSVYQSRFLNNNSAVLYAGYQTGSQTNTGRFIISSGDAPAQIDYLALGDSYISGEGAFDYMPGTDTDTNSCHLSFLSYPFLLSRDLSYNSYHSVACSGATTNDITNTSEFYQSQADKKDAATRAVWDKNGQSDQALGSFLPGYVDQLDFVKLYQPKAITISVGGNDMGFSDILKECVMPSPSNNTCYDKYEDRLELVRQINTTLFSNLIKTYSLLKASLPPDMRIYVIGYPQIAKPDGDCALNVRLNNAELVFAQQLTGYLDDVIKQAAARTGIYYIDTQDALDGHRLCEAGPGSVAINGLTAGNDKPYSGIGPIGDESYHPNALGYELLENRILAATDNLTAPMPAADPAAAPPAENGLPILDAPHSDRSVNTVQYDDGISDDLAYKQVPVNISINGANHALGTGIPLKAQLHSDPIELGTFLTDGIGNLSAQIILPADTPAGYHILHFYGTDLAGRKIDIYKGLWVACTADDLDCDGVGDTAQACIGIPAAGQDFDKDGIDDGCDGNISLPPSPSSIDSNHDDTDASTDQTQNDPADSVLAAALAANQNLESSTSPTVTEAVESSTTPGSQPQTDVLGENTHQSPTVSPVTARIGSNTNPAYLVPVAGIGLMVIAAIFIFRLI